MSIWKWRIPQSARTHSHKPNGSCCQVLAELSFYSPRESSHGTRMHNVLLTSIKISLQANLLFLFVQWNAYRFTRWQIVWVQYHNAFTYDCEEKRLHYARWRFCVDLIYDFGCDATSYSEQIMNELIESLNIAWNYVLIDINIVSSIHNYFVSILFNSKNKTG